MNELLRGAIRLHVLHHAAEDPVHGAWMAAELERHGYRISPGTLYPTLHRMEEEGLLTSARLVVEGRLRRVYEITPAGRQMLAEGIRTLRELAHELLGIPRDVLGEGGAPCEDRAPSPAVLVQASDRPTR